MRGALRIRQLAVQQTWCKPASSCRRGAASLAVRSDEAQTLSSEPVSSSQPTAGPSRLPLTTITFNSPPPTKSPGPSLHPKFFTPRSRLAFSFNASSALIQRLEDHLANVEDDTYNLTPSIEYAEQTYRLYNRLPNTTKTYLSRETYRKLIRSIAPKQRIISTNPDQFAVMERTADKYSRRLRLVIASMRISHGGAQWEDYEVALARLARIGHVPSVEAVYHEMMSSFDMANDPQVQENRHRLVIYRSFAILKWLKMVAVLPSRTDIVAQSRNQDETDHTPKRVLTREVIVEKGSQKLIDSLWSVLKEYTAGTVIPDRKGLAMMTLCINLTRHVFPRADFAKNLDGMMEEIFKKVYGIQLPYLFRADSTIDRVVRPDMNSISTNALIEWLGRGGDTWKMIAAAEIFGGNEQTPRWWDGLNPDLEEEILNMEDKDTAANVASGSSSPLRNGTNDQSSIISDSSSDLSLSAEAQTPRSINEDLDYGPTLSQGLAEEAKLDWLGRPRASSLAERLALESEQHAKQDLANIVAASTSPPARSHAEYDPSTIPSPYSIAVHAGVIPLADIPYAPTYNYGAARNITYMTMIEHVIENRDLIATMHLLRAYVSTAQTQQSEWVYSVVTQARLEEIRPQPDSAAWRRMKEEKALFRIKQKEWIMENERRARIRQDLQARVQRGEAIDVQAEIRTQALQRVPALTPPLYHPRPEKDWLGLLRPPPVWLSANILVKAHAFLRSSRGKSTQGGVTTALRDTQAILEDALSRLEEEHVVLTGRQPTSSQMDLSSYRRTMAERSEANNDAPFAKYLVQLSWRSPNYKFDPVEYSFQLNRMINKFANLLEVTTEQRETRNAKMRRRRISRKIRASLPEKKIELIGASPPQAVRSSHLDLLKEPQKQEETVVIEQRA